jgi:hypothetical protein
MTKNNQNAGDSSIQIKGNNNSVYNGFNEEKIKEIVLEVFQENSIIFKGNAKTVVETKSSDFTNELTENIKKRNPDKLLRLDSPEIQLAIFNALHTYVINNNEHIKKLLMKILEERIFIEDESSFDKIIIDKALKSLSELSKEQLDIITLNYTAFEIAPKGEPKTLEELEEFLYKAYSPFVNIIKSHSRNYTHLESIGLFNSTQLSILYTPYALNEVRDKPTKIRNFTKPGIDNKALSRVYRLVLIHCIRKKFLYLFDEDTQTYKYLDKFINNNMFSKIFELICDTEIQYFRLSPVGRYIAHHYLFEEIIGKTKVNT